MLIYIALVPLVWFACMLALEWMRSGNLALDTTLKGTLLLCVGWPILFCLTPIFWLLVLLCVPIFGWKRLLDQQTWSQLAQQVFLRSKGISLPGTMKATPKLSDFPRKKRAHQ